MPNTIITHWLHILTRILPVLILVIGIAITLALVAVFILKLLALRRQINQPSVCMELTPPAFNDRAISATEQLFSVLWGLGMSQSIKERLLLRRNSFSLEIISTKASGIRYLIRAAESQVDALEHTIHAYLPEVVLSHVDDYMKGVKLKETKVAAFRQTEHFAYPLANHGQLEKYDPVAYLTSAMTKLNELDLVAFQLVIKPRRVREAEILSHKILNNADLLPKLKGNHQYLQKLTTIINKFFLGIINLTSEGFNGTSRADYSQFNNQRQVAQHLKPERTISVFEQQLIDSINQKLALPLFMADIRVLISGNDIYETNKRLKSVSSAISMFNVPKYQKLKPNRSDFGWIRTYRQFAYTKRLSSNFKTSNLLSSSEVSGFYHFPNSITAKTDNVVKSLSRTLPATISLKNGTKLDVVLGINKHHGSTTQIGLTADERQRHVYIIGGTGSGKTTMLLYAIIQDVTNGKGVAVIDPHGDLAEDILRHIPEDRINDVIYMDPSDLDHPIGLNLLELPDGLTGNELLNEKDRITEATVSVMRKIFSDDDSGGHRVEYILRNTVQTALTIEGATLFTIFKLLNDNSYRRKIVNGLDDEDLKNFWSNEVGKAGSFQKVKMAAGITAKIGRFLFSASARRILEQPKSTIDFDDILNSGKIMICNFSKGLLGEDTSTLFGTTILAKLQMAALKRERIKQIDRRPFYLYVDEFQNFAAMSFMQMLSEARKYKLFLTMAEQSTSQQEQQRLVEIILANVGTVICFRSGSPADEKFILPLFAPYISSGEIAYLPAYNFYIRIAAVHAQEPMSGITVVSDDGNAEITKRVIETSRKKNVAEKIEVPQEDHAVDGSSLPKKCIKKSDGTEPSKLQKSIR